MIGSLFKNKSLDYSEAYYQAQRAYKIDPNQDFVRVKSRIGLTAAATYSQIYFSNQMRYKRFRRDLEIHQMHANALNGDYDVLVVLPPRGSLAKGQIEVLLRQTMGLAISAGFDFVSQAQLNTDRVLHGAKRLHNLVLEKKKAGRKLIIVSYSYGSAFVRVMLDNSRPEEVSHIKGWTNLSGMIFGSPLFHCSDKMELFSSTTPSQRTFSSEQKYFLKKMNTHGIKTIHFLGMKNNESLNRAELRQRDRLRAWGPSDGYIPFASYQNLDQTVVPLFDQGHLIDLSSLSLTFVRALSSLVSTVPVKKALISEPSIYSEFS